MANPALQHPHILICAPSRGQLITLPLYVIFSHNKIIYKSAPSVNKIDSSFNQIPPAAIKSINVINSSEAITKYGVAAKNGAIEIYLDDEHFSNAFRFLKPESATVKQKKIDQIIYNMGRHIAASNVSPLASVCD
jgi:hypothetical protein